MSSILREKFAGWGIPKEVAGPTSYSPPGFYITHGEFEKLTFASVQGRGGYGAEVVTYTGNTVLVKALWQACSGSPQVEVASGTDLSGVTFVSVPYGYKAIRTS